MAKKFFLVEEAEFNDIREMLLEIKSAIKNLNSEKDSRNNDWITEAEAGALLKKGATSLYYLRRKEEIVSTKTKPIFYSRKSIFSYLEKSSKQT